MGMTTCTRCRWAEMTPGERLRTRARLLVFGPSRHEVNEHALHAFSQVLAWSVSGSRTPYEEHRERFIRTGDEQELVRMLRHVELPQ